MDGFCPSLNFDAIEPEFVTATGNNVPVATNWALVVAPVQWEQLATLGTSQLCCVTFKVQL
jgi:hypothetical protein